MEDLKIVRKFLEEDFIDFIQDYFSIKINSNQYDKNFKNFKNGYEFYGDPLIETILQNSCEFISDLTDIKVIPRYSITNMFMEGDVYESSVNNFSEITAILLLGLSNSNNKFTINFVNNEKVEMSLGDLLIFNNTKIKIKKTKISNNWILQSSLNFLDDEG